MADITSNVNVPKFLFLPIAKTFDSLDGKDYQEYFLKWSIKDRMTAKMFTFDQSFQAYEKDKFAMDFFRDHNVTSSLQVLSDSGKSKSLGTKADHVAAVSIPCTVLSMTFFDKLFEGEIARESGDIKKCYDDFKGDFTISDNLRQMLLMEDSDVYCEFNEKEREEFLFLIFSHFCLGGRLCQYEDTVQPYLDVTKAVYKDFISVQKTPETKELSILSHVFKVSCFDEAGEMYFPSSKRHHQDFAYLIVDPLKRTVICFYHAFGSSF